MLQLVALALICLPGLAVFCLPLGVVLLYGRDGRIAKRLGLLDD